MSSKVTVYQEHYRQHSAYFSYFDIFAFIRESTVEGGQEMCYLWFVVSTLNRKSFFLSFLQVSALKLRYEMHFLFLLFHFIFKSVFDADKPKASLLALAERDYTFNMYGTSVLDCMYALFFFLCVVLFCLLCPWANSNLYSNFKTGRGSQSVPTKTFLVQVQSAKTQIGSTPSMSTTPKDKRCPSLVKWDFRKIPLLSTSADLKTCVAFLYIQQWRERNTPAEMLAFVGSSTLWASGEWLKPCDTEFCQCELSLPRGQPSVVAGAGQSDV